MLVEDIACMAWTVVNDYNLMLNTHFPHHPHPLHIVINFSNSHISWNPSPTHCYKVDVAGPTNNMGYWCCY